MLKVNWHIGIQQWAYRHLATHVIQKLKCFEHVFNDKGDVNIVMAMDQAHHTPADKHTIIHLDGNRWYEENIKS
jgi:hypothetical protein